MTGIFKPTSDAMLKHLQQRIEQQRLTFLLPTSHMSVESAQLGFLLNQIFSRGSNKQYKTFFANSSLEALQGAIKIARHRALKLNPKAEGKILIYDKSNDFKEYCNPLRRARGEELIPGVEFFSELPHIADFNCAAIIIRVDHTLRKDEILELFAECKRHKVITILDESSMDYREVGFYGSEIPADVIVLGETLTDHQVPFGAFSMTNDTYKPWNNLQNCMLHSSTYSGNCLALSTVLTNLQRHMEFSIQEKKLLSKISSSRKTRIKNYAKYVNPNAALLYQLAGYDFNVVKATGMQLTTDTGIELLDIAGCAGCNLRGHNHQDIVPKVLLQHDNRHDYWQELSNLLTQLTGLEHAFAGISGANAVEVCIIMALLANPTKTRILTFKNNYAGKTFVALNGTHMGGLREPFAPLYHDVVVIDPFSADAESELVKQLNSGELALVWFESLSHGEPLPDKLLALIDEHKHKNGYYIGVDEVLMGAYRTGNFLHSHGLVKSPDVISMSKGLSDMIFPNAAAMLSQDVYEKARQNNPALVQYLERVYVNQLAAHITYDALTQVQKHNVSANVNAMGAILKSGLEEVAESTNFIEKIHGKGLFLSLGIKPSFVVKVLDENLIKMFIAHEHIKISRTFTFLGSYIPALTLSKRDAHHIVNAAQKVLGNKRLSYFVSRGLLRLIKIFCLKFF